MSDQKWLNEDEVEKWLKEQLQAEKNQPAREAPQPVSEKSRNYGSRLVIVEDIYHARSNGSTSHLQPSFRRFLKSNDQVYGPRELVAVPTWQKVDCGWIQKCSLLVIINQAKSDNLEDLEWHNNTLEVVRSKNDPGENSSAEVWYIPPEESLRGVPSSLNSLWVRSRVGQVPYTVTVIPE